MKLVLPLIAVLALTACSNRQAYDSLQGARQQECGKIVDNGERERCYATANQSYDSYEKQRNN